MKHHLSLITFSLMKRASFFHRNDLEETEEEEAFPLDSGDVIEDEPIIEEGEFLPEGM